MTDTTYTAGSGNSSNLCSDNPKELTKAERLLTRSWWSLEDDLNSKLALNLWQSLQAQIDNACMYHYDLDSGEAAILQALLYTYMGDKFDIR